MFFFRCSFQINMKAIICLVVIIGVAAAYPAQEGAAYTGEAIRQAQSSHLIPQNAQIQSVRSIMEIVNFITAQHKYSFHYFL